MLPKTAWMPRKGRVFALVQEHWQIWGLTNHLDKFVPLIFMILGGFSTSSDLSVANATHVSIKVKPMSTLTQTNRMYLLCTQSWLFYTWWTQCSFDGLSVYTWRNLIQQLHVICKWLLICTWESWTFGWHRLSFFACSCISAKLTKQTSQICHCPVAQQFLPWFECKVTALLSHCDYRWSLMPP